MPDPIGSLSTLSCSGKQFQLIGALWHGSISCWKWPPEDGYSMVINRFTWSGSMRTAQSVGAKWPKMLQQDLLQRHQLFLNSWHKAWWIRVFMLFTLHLGPPNQMSQWKSGLVRLYGVSPPQSSVPLLFNYGALLQIVSSVSCFSPIWVARRDTVAHLHQQCSTFRWRSSAFFGSSEWRMWLPLCPLSSFWLRPPWIHFYNHLS